MFLFSFSFLIIKMEPSISEVMIKYNIQTCLSYSVNIDSRH